MPSTKTDIVVGVDFGTTYSGVSWCLGILKDKANVINNWPNPDCVVGNSSKVPTAISYGDNGRVQKWGWAVTADDKKAFRWLKIMLDPSHKFFNEIPNIGDMQNCLRELGKTVEDVVTDYLKCLWDFTISELKKKKGKDLEEMYNLDVVLTVPAVWSELAKDRTLRAAKRAGLPATSRLVTEPEAAALALLKQRSDEHDVKIGDGFVVCDAGGGTVDLISYKIEGLNPLKVRECVVGDGDLCGSVFLDFALQRHIETVLGQDKFVQIKDRQKARMRSQLESIKRSFSETSGDKFIEFNHGQEEDSKNDIEEDGITIRQNTFRTLFDSICFKIQRLVQGQIKGMLSKGLKPKAIALVGGFGESSYLYHYLDNANKGKNVKILQEPDGISAVCRGATLWGLEQRNATSIVARIARTSYGIHQSNTYDSTKHLLSDRWYCAPKGHWYASNQMTWLLTRGTEIVEGQILKGPEFEPLCIPNSMQGDWGKTRHLYYSREEVPPPRFDHPSVKELCSLTYGISYSELLKEPTYAGASGETCRDFSYSLDITCGATVLDFQLHYKGRLIQSIKADYKEN